jgi:hypothetical protein
MPADPGSIRYRDYQFWPALDRTFGRQRFTSRVIAVEKRHELFDGHHSVGCAGLPRRPAVLQSEDQVVPDMRRRQELSDVRRMGEGSRATVG